jgi:hypothetical protein
MSNQNEGRKMKKNEKKKKLLAKNTNLKKKLLMISIDMMPMHDIIK